MNISRLAIRNPVFAWMLMSSLIFFGALGLSRLGISHLPDIDFPVVTVRLTLEGAAPEVMEMDVVEPLEDALMSVEGVREIRSTARQNSADITVELELSRDVDIAVQEIQTRVAQTQRRLPADLEPAQIRKTNPEDQPIIWIAVTTERSQRELMMYVQDRLKNEFQTIPGVGEVFLGGYVDRNVRIWLNAERLNRYELTADDIIATIQEQHIEVPAGRLETGPREYSIRSLGQSETVEAFNEIYINRRGGAPVRRLIPLSEVAEIEDGLADITRLSRFNGKRAVGIGIRKQRNSNAVEVGRLVKERLEEVQPRIPEGFAAQLANDQTRYIEESVRELQFTLILSAVLTGLVTRIFLGSWSSTLNILLAIPTSIVGTFLFIYFAGFTLNTFTLLALALATGIVVDDAIMVLENITRHRQMGKGAKQGALDGVLEITFAAIATTAALIAIFLPVAFMEGVIGYYFFQFAITISVAVALSSVDALTLTPMRCAQFLRVGGPQSRFDRAFDRLFSRIERLYRATLDLALNHRWKVVAAAILIFAASFSVLNLLKQEFVPAQDQSRLMLFMQTPVGSSIEYTDEKVRRLEAILSERPEVLRYFAAIGGLGTGELNRGTIFLTLKDRPERPVDPELGRRPGHMDFAATIRREMAKDPELEDLRLRIMDPSLRGFSTGRGFPIEFTIRGPDWEELAALSEQMQEAMEASGLVIDVDSNYDAGRPEIRIYPNRVAAAERGVSMGNIGRTISTLMGGSRVGTFAEGGRSYDIRIRLEEGDRREPEDILRHYVRNNYGEIVPIRSVVSIREEQALQTITRVGRERAITVYGNPAEGVGQQQAFERTMELAREILPDGYNAIPSGSSQATEEAFVMLLGTLWMGIIIAYMVLGSQFNSFVHPFTVLLALPFSFSGAFLALYLTGQTINIYSFIGLILLMGLVKKNSILLVEFANQKRAEGMELFAAIREAGRVRLRPIIMTAFSSIAAALPPALAIGPGSETRIPMAVAVIGGLLFSTLLTLVVVPVAYTLMARFERQRDEE